MLRRAALMLAILVSTALIAAKSSMPPIPYYDHGACPFECCTYRSWTAEADTSLHKETSDSSPVVGRVKAGQTVQSLTGVVITSKPGKIKILKAVTLDPGKKISLKPGDIVYSLHYMGEGFERLWFNGQMFEAQTDVDDQGKDKCWEIISRSEYVWWAEIRMPDGTIGWTRDLDHFSNIDACS